MRIDLQFHERHVIVFGGTTGINFGIADAFARQGADVTVVSRRRENVDSAVERLSAHGHRVGGACADVRDFAAVGLALSESVTRFGPVDVLVSGAAGNFLCSAHRMSANGFKSVVDIDLMGTFHVLRQAYEHLRKPGAALINITAPQSAIPMRYQAHACAAKAGVNQLTRVLALEWGVEGLRVNAISPGIGEIFGTRVRHEGVPLLIKLRLEAVVEGLPDQALDAADGQRGAGSQALRHLVRARFERRKRHHLVDQAEPQRFGGVEGLAEQRDRHRVAHADDARQAPRA